MKNNEIWKDIKEYEGLYQVSNYGNIKSFKRKTRNLKPYKTYRGYYGIKLCKNHQTKQFFVHRLVAEAFIPNPYNKPQVNHINGNKTDNNIVNLEWATSSENIIHAYSTGLSKGKAIPILQFDKNGDLVEFWSSQTEAGRALNIKQSDISRCCNLKSKTANNFIWRKL